MWRHLKRRRSGKQSTDTRPNGHASQNTPGTNEYAQRGTGPVAAVSADPAPAAPAPIRVVLVDDDAPIRMLMRPNLESAGYLIVAEGATGDGAVRLAQTHLPDLMLLDNQMGEDEMSGIDALPKVLECSPLTAVVMVSADSELADRAIELGATGFISKPFNPRRVAQNIAALLDRRKP